DIIPSFIIAKDSEGNPFVQGYGNSFYSKSSNGPIFIQQLLIYLGMIAAVLTFIYAVLGIPLAWLKKISLNELFLAVLPALGVLSFFGAYRLMSFTDAVQKELFTTMNWTTFCIFFGMLFL